MLKGLTFSVSLNLLQLYRLKADFTSANAAKKRITRIILSDVLPLE